MSAITIILFGIVFLVLAERASFSPSAPLSPARARRFRRNGG